jgi:hypothetical protein
MALWDKLAAQKADKGEIGDNYLTMTCDGRLSLSIVWPFEFFVRVNPGGLAARPMSLVVVVVNRAGVSCRRGRQAGLVGRAADDDIVFCSAERARGAPHGGAAGEDGA